MVSEARAFLVVGVLEHHFQEKTGDSSYRTYGARSLMARNSTERLGGEYNLESTGSAFPAHLSRSQHSSPKHL